jgi:hypothetical protein
MRLTIALGLSTAFLAACSSASFDMPAAPVTDSGNGSDAADVPLVPDEAGADAALAPCPTSPDEATFCVGVSLPTSRPGYGPSSGATSLGLDGAGVVFVYLFDKDPGASTTGGTAPIATLQYPPATKIGSEVHVDKDFPVRVSGSAPPGTYWISASFQDSKTARDAGLSALLPGDYVLAPTTLDKKAIYPKVTLEKGKAGTLEVLLKPRRRVDVNLSSAGLLPYTASGNPTIHGDGPVLFALYDGDLLAGTGKFVDVSYVPCATLPLKSGVPATTVSFGVTLDAQHEIFAELFDYEVPTTPDGSAQGTISTPLSGADVAVVTPVETSWIATADLKFTDIWSAYPATSDKPDPLHCAK